MAYRAAMHDETMRKGSWVEEEDERLTTVVTLLGERRWDSIARASGLRRSGKSCRMRWMNYLRPNLKHGRMSAEEENIIFQLHERWGNKWSKIAQRLPGRTDNELKNYWRTHLRKEAQVPQEQENWQRDATCSTQGLLIQESNQSTQITSFEVSEFVKEGISGAPEDLSALEDYAFASSPYETNLSDWISELSNDQSAVEHHGECNILDPWFCYPAWIYGNGDSIWDC